MKSLSIPHPTSNRATDMLDSLRARARDLGDAARPAARRAGAAASDFASATARSTGRALAGISPASLAGLAAVLPLRPLMRTVRRHPVAIAAGGAAIAIIALAQWRRSEREAATGGKSTTDGKRGGKSGTKNAAAH